MKTLGMLLIAGIIWTQTGPADKKGCAPFMPTITDGPPAHTQEYKQPVIVTPEPSSPQSTESYRANDGYDMKIGDNTGHGQFDSNSDGEDE